MQRYKKKVSISYQNNLNNLKKQKIVKTFRHIGKGRKSSNSNELQITNKETSGTKVATHPGFISVNNQQIWNVSNLITLSQLRNFSLISKQMWSTEGLKQLIRNSQKEKHSSKQINRNMRNFWQREEDQILRQARVHFPKKVVAHKLQKTSEHHHNFHGLLRQSVVILMSKNKLNFNKGQQSS